MTDYPEHLWPDVPRLVFGSGTPVMLNACVGWVLSRRGDMHGYIEGYRAAASVLYADAAARGTSPDYLVFPLAFMWRQHVELALKEIISLGRQVRGEPAGFPNGHKLDVLWREALQYVTQCGDPTAPEVSNVESNIREFAKIDPFGDGFRYPMNRDQTGVSLPQAPTHVNLRVLHEAMTAVGNFLSGVSSVLSERLDYIVANTGDRDE